MMAEILREQTSFPSTMPSQGHPTEKGVDSSFPGGNSTVTSLLPSSGKPTSCPTVKKDRNSVQA